MNLPSNYGKLDLKLPKFKKKTHDSYTDASHQMEFIFQLNNITTR